VSPAADILGTYVFDLSAVPAVFASEPNSINSCVLKDCSGDDNAVVLTTWSLVLHVGIEAGVFP
jgi:hypothetical protein